MKQIDQTFSKSAYFEYWPKHRNNISTYFRNLIVFERKLTLTNTV